MLIFTLKKEWYEKIKSGEKTIEYREVKPYWTQMLLKNAYNCESMVGNYVLLKKGDCVPCKLRLGYTGKYMTAIITRIEIVDGKDTDLHIDKPVYAIHLKPESEYRPYKDCDEMIADFKTRFNIPAPPDAMPLIWVKNKGNKNVLLVTGFDYDNRTCKKLGVYTNSSWYDFEEFFNYFTYLDDTPCGVKE